MVRDISANTSAQFGLDARRQAGPSKDRFGPLPPKGRESQLGTVREKFPRKPLSPVAREVAEGMELPSVAQQVAAGMEG